MELGIDDIPGEDEKKYKDGMQVGNVLIKTRLPGSLLFQPNPLHSPVQLYALKSQKVFSTTHTFSFSWDSTTTSVATLNGKTLAFEPRVKSAVRFRLCFLHLSLSLPLSLSLSDVFYWCLWSTLRNIQNGVSKNCTELLQEKKEKKEVSNWFPSSLCFLFWRGGGVSLNTLFCLFVCEWMKAKHCFYWKEFLTVTKHHRVRGWKPKCPQLRTKGVTRKEGRCRDRERKGVEKYFNARESDPSKYENRRPLHRRTSQNIGRGESFWGEQIE